MVKAKLIKTPEPAQTRAQALCQRLLENNKEREIYCASDLTKNWRYIDFVDPKTGLPCLCLEWFYGSRGLLAGRVLKLQAKYGVGKSSLMFFQYACGQLKGDAYCYHVESEAAPPPPDFIASFGCDPEKLLIGQPKSLEEAFELMDELLVQVRGGFGGDVNAEGRHLKTKFTDPLDPTCTAPIIMGFDSISGIGGIGATDIDILDLEKTKSLGYHARKVSEWFQARSGRLKTCQALLMMAAHEKANIQTGQGRGGKDTTTIANAPIGFHSTWVVLMNNYKLIDGDGHDIGEKITLFTEKNKISPKHRTLEIFLVRDQGFDMLRADADFLLKNANSPIEGSRHSAGVSCKALSNKSFKNDEEFLRAFYGNTDFCMAMREKLRIRGYGFDFETKYMPSPLEVEDNAPEKSAESELTNGLERTPGSEPGTPESK